MLFQNGIRIALLLLASTTLCNAQTNWTIVLPPSYQDDAAIQFCLNDIKTLGQELHISFEVSYKTAEANSPVLFVGAPSRNPAAKTWIEQNQIDLPKAGHEQGFVIKTHQAKNNKAMFVSGGSETGDLYGLYWVWDRMRVTKTLPSLSAHRVPALKIRHAGGENETDIQNALRHTANWVSGKKHPQSRPLE